MHRIQRVLFWIGPSEASPACGGLLYREEQSSIAIGWCFSLSMGEPFAEGRGCAYLKI